MLLGEKSIPTKIFKNIQANNPKIILNDFICCSRLYKYMNEHLKCLYSIEEKFIM